MINQNFACAPEMIGFYLNRRREARLCLDMENEIKRMLKDEEQNDVSQSGKKQLVTVIVILFLLFSFSIHQLLVSCSWVTYTSGEKQKGSTQYQAALYSSLMEGA